MAMETIKRIQDRIEHAPSITAEDKRIIQELLSQLKSEVENLPDIHQDDLRTMVGFAEVSAHEATREQSNPDLMEFALKGMRTSVDGFQERHPALVSVVHDFAAVLSRMGF